MFKIKETDPAQSFEGMDTDGWLNYPNMFHCPKCEYGIYFNQESLAKGSVHHQNKPMKLTWLRAALFSCHIKRFISNKSERFILDFICPRCKSPYVIGFESREFHMGHDRYRPLIILGS